MTHQTAASTGGPDGGGAADRVDPRAPRFGQSITATLLALAVVLQVPLLVGVVAVILGTAVVSRWRHDPYAALWRHGVRRVVGPPVELDTAAPHRFAKLLGAVGTALGSLAFLAGVPLAGYLLAAAVALAAGLAAATGYCLGCRLYGQVRFFQRLDVV